MGLFGNRPSDDDDMPDLAAALAGAARSYKKSPERTELKTVEDYAPFLSFFDNRDFEIGTFVQKRAGMKDRDEGGLNHLRWPLEGEPALVVGHCEPTTNADGPYDHESLVILVFTSDNTPVRFAVDPVFFEKYETPGERMLREMAEEEQAKADTAKE